MPCLGATRLPLLAFNSSRWLPYLRCSCRLARVTNGGWLHGDLRKSRHASAAAVMAHFGSAALGKTNITIEREDMQKRHLEKVVVAATTYLSDYYSWVGEAACRGLADLFYNEEYETKGVRRSKERHAKAICLHCPVVAPCRRHALVRTELYGVWGGLTENERHRLAGRDRTG